MCERERESTLVYIISDVLERERERERSPTSWDGREREKGDSKWVTRDCEVVLDCVPAGGVLLRHQAARHQSQCASRD